MDFLQTLSFLLIYIVLPASVIALVVYLIFLVKQITVSTKNMDKITTDLEHKLAMLDEPVEAVVNIFDGVSQVMGIANATVAGFSAFAGRKARKTRKNKRREEDY